jgi:hypothetical protein
VMGKRSVIPSPIATRKGLPLPRLCFMQTPLFGSDQLVAGRIVQ